METLFPEYEPIKSQLLVGDFISRLKKKEPKEKSKRGITSERQAITDEIAELIQLESDRPVNKKLLSIKLSHIPTEDLYFLKSEGLDYKKRKGEPFGKYVYGSIKVKKL